jgi:ParB-like chromosome segregation protein Spo0J
MAGEVGAGKSGRFLRHNDVAVDTVAASIKEFGWRVSNVCDEDLVIIAGETRFKAAKKLDLKKCQFTTPSA